MLPSETFLLPEELTKGVHHFGGSSALIQGGGPLAFTLIAFANSPAKAELRWRIFSIATPLTAGARF
jgi:hypothetical protein